MTDRELLAAAYKLLKLLYSPNIPIMVALRERLEKDE